LRLTRADPAILHDRPRFLAVAATAMRQILINHAEARNTEKRGGGRPRAGGEQADLLEASEIDLESVLDVDAALKKLEALDPRKAKVVEARIFGGMSNAEVAESLGMSLSTVESDWRMAKAWLARELEA
jgi:RNA polymerase sigma factor (TIGR02999 family)